jgi:hypothetical protein
METPHIWTVKVLTSDTYRDPVKVLDAADRTIASASLTAWRKAGMMGAPLKRPKDFNPPRFRFGRI